VVGWVEREENSTMTRSLGQRENSSLERKVEWERLRRTTTLLVAGPHQFHQKADCSESGMD
jgi:hypothetical protein